MAFPSTLSVFPSPSTSSRLDNPSHSALHNQVSSALGQIEAVIGVEGANSVVGTLEYLIKSPASDGGGHVQTAAKGGTGQTTYTKGDILVAQNSSTLTKLAIGSDNQVIVANSSTATGINWAAVPAISVSSTIAVSSVWTKPPGTQNTSRIFIETWGAGGSGGTGTATNSGAGGGGGSYASAWLSASMIATSVIINVGQGGNAVSSSGNAPGLLGGNTVFDVQNSLLTAYGGGGGGGGAATNAGGGGGGILQPGLTSVSAINTGSGLLYGGVMNVQTTNGTQTINLGNNQSVVAAFLAAPNGGGGGGGTGAAAGGAASLIGGRSTYGGGGGGGIGNSVVGGSVQGGFSQFGGNGGNSSVITSGSTMAGQIPGGGGGAAYGTGGSSGPGGHGMAKITVFF